METEENGTQTMERIENDFIKLWIDNGIMFGKYKPDVLIDIKAAKKVVEDRIRLAKGVDYPTLGFLDDLSNVTKEARDFFSHDDGVKNMKKLALLTGSPISKMFGNFFLKISKPTIPTRLFTRQEDALVWLKE